MNSKLRIRWKYMNLHTQTVFTKVRWAVWVYTERKKANAIINPACDILPDTYNDELTNYFDWIKENL
jgi:hypothetical protein